MITRRSLRLALLLVLAPAVAAGLPACSPDPSTGASRSDSSAGTPGSPAPSETSSPAPAATSTAEPDPAGTVPLVLAVHPSRGSLHVTAATARRVMAGQVRDWRRLGAQAGPLRVLAAADPVGTAAAGAGVAQARPDAAVRAASRDPAVLAVVPASAMRPGVAAVTVEGRHPMRSPASYPLRTAGTGRPDRVTVVRVVGDVMMGRRVGDRLASDNDYRAALRPTAHRLAAADLTVGNLESTLSMAGAPRQGGDSFGADPRVLRGLRLAGFDVLSLANNHVGDYGPAALVRTVRRVRAGGFEPVGAGRHLAEAQRPAVVTRDGVRIGVLAFDAIGESPAAGPSSPGVLRVRMQPRTGPLNRGDLDRVLASVRALRDRVDVVMVVPHWGTQYTTQTVTDQRRVGRALVRAGADVVVGGHPHWVQGAELHRQGLIVYSLGNYVFDMDFSRPTQEGAILELVLWDGRVRNAELVPVVIGGDFAPRVVQGAAARAILTQVWDASGPPLAGTGISRGG